MKAVTYQGIKNVIVKEVPDPKIEKPDDMIVKMTTTAICGSDLHLYHGLVKVGILMMVLNLTRVLEDNSLCLK